jgi:hypothetical protein
MRNESHGALIAVIGDDNRRLHFSSARAGYSWRNETECCSWV